MIVYQALKWYWALTEKGKDEADETRDDVSLQSSMDSFPEPLEEDFERASDIVRRNVEKMSSTDALTFYGLYKRATAGKANEGDRPKGFDLMKRYRFDAWLSTNNITKSQAMEQYIIRVHQLFGFQKLKPQISKGGFGIRPSTLQQSDSELDDEDSGRLTPGTKGWFFTVTKLDYARMDELLKENPRLIHMKNEIGLTALHYAVDRELNDLIDYLIEKGADVNSLDDEGQTPLYIAVECGYKEVVSKLLRVGADPAIANFEGDCPLDIVTNGEIRQILEIALQQPA